MLNSFRDFFTGPFQGSTALRRLLALSILLHLVSAYFSTGYFQFDEHYQIIEFASYKMGITHLENLPWEFHTCVRPWAAPALLFCLWKFAALFGIGEPFTLAFVFRIFAGLLALFASTTFFCVLQERFSKPEQKIFLFVMLNFLWFVPFLHVHASSESFTTSFYLLGLSLLMIWNRLPPSSRFQTYHLIGAGLCWGLAFEMRFQIAFMILGAVGWYWYMRPTARTKLAAGLAAGFFTIFVLGRLLDTWGYGHFVLTPWLYFRMAIIEGVPNHFSREPLLYYFTSFLSSFPPLSVVFFFAVFAALWRFPKTIFTTIVLSLMIPHLIIAHKELRYFFPLAPFYTVLIVMLVYDRHSPFTVALGRFFRKRWVWMSCAALNLMGLVIFSFFLVPPQMPIYRFVAKLGVRPFRYVAVGGDPFYPAGIKAEFYNPEVQKFADIEDDYDWTRLPRDPKHDSYIVQRGVVEAPIQFPKDLVCQKIYDDSPWWMKLSFGERIARKTKLRTNQIYECRS